MAFKSCRGPITSGVLRRDADHSADNTDTLMHSIRLPIVRRFFHGDVTSALPVISVARNLHALFTRQVA